MLEGTRAKPLLCPQRTHQNYATSNCPGWSSQTDMIFSKSQITWFCATTKIACFSNRNTSALILIASVKPQFNFFHVFAKFVPAPLPQYLIPSELANTLYLIVHCSLPYSLPQYPHTVPGTRSRPRPSIPLQSARSPRGRRAGPPGPPAARARVGTGK